MLYYAAFEKEFGKFSSDGEPAGEEWDFVDEVEMKKRLPKLYKKVSE